MSIRNKLGDWKRQQKGKGGLVVNTRNALKSWKYRRVECSVGAETLWAEVFNSTIANSRWLKNTSFSPGRWAVGYPYLYVLYRILNEWKPQEILDIGLGQSTKMIAQYAATNEQVHHLVVEHDPQWIQFFSEANPLPPNVCVVNLELEQRRLAGCEAPHKPLWQYRDFMAGLERDGKCPRFQLISVDGPFGSKSCFSRGDILALIPQGLAESFVIMVDDCERYGEIGTVQLIERRLGQNGIPYAKGDYIGAKRVVTLASKDLQFLTTL